MEWKVESNIETARGNDCLVIRSEQGRYKYSRIRPLTNGEVRYRCTNRSCNVNVFVDSENRVTRASNLLHSHEGLKPSQYTLVKLRTACKQYARENLGNKPIEELMRDAYDIGAFAIPPSKKRLLKKAIHTARRHVISQRLKEERFRKIGVFTPPKPNGSTPAEGPIEIEDDVEMEVAVPECELLDGRDHVFVEAVPVPVVPKEPSNVGRRSLTFKELPSSSSSQPSTSRSLPSRARSHPSSSQAQPSTSQTHPEAVIIKTELDIKTEIVEETDAPSSSLSALPTFKQELLDEEDVAESPEPAEFHLDKTTQTDDDPDQTFLNNLLPMMKKLTPGDKSMVKAQIQQLFMWKLKGKS